MWFEHHILELGEAGRNLRGYKVREYGLSWGIARWQKPQRAAYGTYVRAYLFRPLLEYIPGIGISAAFCAVLFIRAHN